MATSGDWVAATSVKLTCTAAAHVAKAARTALNSPPVSAVPSSKAKVSCGVGHAQRVTNATPLTRSGMPQRCFDICVRVASSNSPVTGRACRR